MTTKLWAMANELRGSMDAAEYKNYILAFMFYRYLSENTFSVYGPTCGSGSLLLQGLVRQFIVMQLDVPAPALPRFSRTVIVVEIDYVDTFEEEQVIDLAEVSKLLAQDKQEITELEAKINEQLKILGINM
ncbi:type I restriction-modification system subunit M N-terminal domain-containing protein [Paenibacillus enshidis]|uniref:Type I restriction-modification system subunit M N-terminal domain-containing protein n=1 Tax=Paenibacillus enshidis TaxID=1458439 RepID=A0ABV5AYA9_9BACL